jgi:DtxR family transcriptional regulator, Mn-dependent transcriptional regulator
MSHPPSITNVLEDYLEAILVLVDQKGVARVRDLAGALSVHKSPVTSALRSWAGKGFVNYSAYEAATLTPAGRQIAEDVTRRHAVIRDFFIEVLSVDCEVANANACRMEHIVDAEVIERLTSLARFIRDCPNARQRCLARFQEYLADPDSGTKCADPLAAVLPTVELASEGAASKAADPKLSRESPRRAPQDAR